jgi:hypothetical protein
VFHTADFSASLAGEVKTLTLLGGDTTAVLVANFGATEQAATLALPAAQGTWYEYFSQTSAPAADLQSATLAPGAYRLFTSVPLARLPLPFVEVPDIPTGIAPVAAAPASPLHVYPNPAARGQLIADDGQLKAGDRVEVYSLQGLLVGAYTAEGKTTTLNIAHLPAGAYIVRVGGRAAKVVVN